MADIGLLAGFMVVNTGKNWIAANVSPVLPGGPGSWPQMLGSAAMDAAADLSKFVLFDLSRAAGAVAATNGNGG
jgi:hypothetical protein